MNRTMLGTIVALLLGLAALGLYWQSLDNEFIWDDPIIFKRQLPYFDSLANVFSPPRSIPQFGTHYYRPLTIVSFQIDELLAKTFWPLEEREEARRLTYHASVIAYNAIATVLVFLLGLRLARLSKFGEELALAVGAGAAMLFAVHPIHVECVSWMAGRTDVLCAVFAMAALISYLRLRERENWADLVAAVGFALASMLTKETGVGIVLLLPLVDVLVPAGKGRIVGEKLTRAERRRRERSGRARGRAGGLPAGVALRWVLLGAAAGFYFLLRSRALPAGHMRSAGRSFVDFFAGLGWYVKKIFWPPPQSAFVSGVPGGGYAALGVLALVAGAVLLILIWRRREALGEGLAIAAFFALMAPSLAIVLFRISETPLAERYLYSPSIGVCLLVALLLARVAGKLAAKRSPALRMSLVLVPLLILALPMASATRDRQRVWKSDLAFWTDNVAKAGDQGLPHLHLGLTFNAMGYSEKAIAEYKEALVKYDDAEGRSKAYNNLGSAYIAAGDIEQAVDALRGALREIPNYSTAHYNLALCEITLARRSGERQERIEHINAALGGLQRALRINPRYVKANFKYGELLLDLGRTEEGRRHLEQVVRLAPASQEAVAARALLQRK